jgi:hypothetical protein
VTGWLRRVVRGCTCARDGRPYQPTRLAEVWERLRGLCRNASIMPLLSGPGDAEVAARLFAAPAVTLTGRVRAGCTYTQSRNTPFQGLAADGAKLALFELIRRGWIVTAFIHDEILVEVPLGSDYASAGDELVNVMVGAMARVCPGVPIECGRPVPMTRWSKDAEAVYDADGRLVPWSPPDERIHGSQEVRRAA